MYNWLEIGKRIKKQRELLGYTREELAEMADITPRFCYDLELGLKGMSVETLCKLHEALELSTDYLLFGTDKKSAEPEPIISLLKRCPEHSIDYLTQIISLYIRSLETAKHLPDHDTEEK